MVQVSSVYVVDVNTAVPLVDQPDEAEVLATRPMSYVLAVDNGNVTCLSLGLGENLLCYLKILFLYYNVSASCSMR